MIKAIRSIDGDQSVYDVRTLSEIVDLSMSQRRLTTLMMTTFSGLALLLAAVGIYGVIAYGVSQRLREFGIRVALGASRGEVKRLVVSQGATMAFTGCAVGLIIVISASGALKSLVFGVQPTDAISVVGATVVLMLVSMLASYIPARRAAAVDPGVTLRAD